MLFQKPIIKIIALLSVIAFFVGLGRVAILRDQAVRTEIKPQVSEIGVTEHLGDQISISDLKFQDEQGKPVVLGDYFKRGKPVLLTLVYYQCPNLCNFLLNGLLASLKSFEWTPGDQFELVTVSIHPKETPELADKKKASYLSAYDRPTADLLTIAQGWHFLTVQKGQEDQVQKLAEEVGFHYQYDPSEKQYAHSAVIYALTPEGKISRYLYGIEFPQKSLKLALLEASSGKIGSVVDRILLFCYRYDPQSRKYSVYLTKLMQAGCGGTMIVFGGYLIAFWRRQRKGASLR